MKSTQTTRLLNHGYAIHKERKSVINRFNEKTSVTEYSLAVMLKATV